MPPLSCFFVLKRKCSHNGKKLSEYIVLRESYMWLLGKITEGDRCITEGYWCVIQHDP